jgi:MFS transporter, DHA1 family, tetracycline resistance protein
MAKPPDGRLADQRASRFDLGRRVAFACAVARSSTSRRRGRERQPLPPGFGIIWTTVAIDLVGFGIVLPILPQYAHRFGASATTTGLLVASYSLAQFALAPVWGRLSDRVGRKPVLIIALFGTAIGSLLTGLAGALPLLFVGRLIDGGSGGSVSVAQAAVADVAAPRDRARLMGLLGAAFGVGFVAGPAIVAVGALAGPRVPFYVAAAIAGINALVAIRRLPETHGPRAAGRPVAPPPGPSAAAADLVDDPSLLAAELELAGTLDGPQPGTPFDRGAAASGDSVGGPDDVGDRPAGLIGRIDKQALIRLLVVSFVGMVAFSGFESTFALLTEDRFGLKEAGTGAIFTVIGLALVAVQVGVIGRVNERLGESGTLRVGLAANAAGLALLAVDGGWATLVPALALLVLGQGLITPTLSSAIAGRAARARGAWLGWQQSVAALARVAGPVLAGILFTQIGVGAPYVVGAVLVVGALTCVPSVARAVTPPAA